MSWREPARGVLAGIRADAKKAKETGETYQPNGTGVAWSHNFLNQKPWHPLSYRNQKRKFEAEEKALHAAKTNQEAQREFEEEQTRLHNMSFLREEDRNRYKELQSVSFMYAKPPGMDAALQKEKQSTEEKPDEGRQPAADASSKDRARRPSNAPRLDVGALLAAKDALAAQQRLELKCSGYRSPTRGSYDAKAANQQFVFGASSEEEDAGEEIAEGDEGDRSAGTLGCPTGAAASELDAAFSSIGGTEDLERLVADLPDKERRRVLRAYAEWRVAFEDKQRVGGLPSPSGSRPSCKSAAFGIQGICALLEDDR